MKKISYALSIFIIFLAFIINGEGYQLHLSSVITQFPYSTFKTPEGRDREEMLKNVMEVTEALDVEFFVEDSIHPQNNKEITTYYANEKVKEILVNDYDIVEGTYKGIINGTTEIKYESVDEIKNLSRIDAYYFIGDMDNIMSVYEELSKSYEGMAPMEGYSMFDCDTYTIMIWIIAGVVILLLQLVAMLMNKKENMLKITFGESKLIIVMKAVVCDFVFFLITIIGTYCLADRYTCVDFNSISTIIMVGIILLLNTLINIAIPFGNYKKVFSNIAVSKKMLGLGYGLKILSSVMVTVVVSVCIMFLSRGLEEQKQKDFFERYKDYDYIYLGYHENEEMNILETEQKISKCLMSFTEGILKNLT